MVLAGMTLSTGDAIQPAALAAIRQSVGWEVASIPGQLQAMREGHRTIYLVSDGALPVATVTIEWGSEADGAEAAFLNDLAVRPDYQRRGIGHALVGLAEREVCRRGFRAATIQTNIPRVAELYGKWGYSHPWATPDGFTLLTKELR